MYAYLKSSFLMDDLNFDKVFKWWIDKDNIFQSFGPALLNAPSTSPFLLLSVCRAKVTVS